MASCDKRFSFLTTEFKETLLVQLFPLLEIVLLTCLFLRALAVIFDKLPCCNLEERSNSADTAEEAAHSHATAETATLDVRRRQLPSALDGFGDSPLCIQPAWRGPRSPRVLTTRSARCTPTSTIRFLFAITLAICATPSRSAPTLHTAVWDVLPHCLAPLSQRVDVLSSTAAWSAAGGTGADVCFASPPMQWSTDWSWTLFTFLYSLLSGTDNSPPDPPECKETFPFATVFALEETTGNPSKNSGSPAGETGDGGCGDNHDHSAESGNFEGSRQDPGGPGEGGGGTIVAAQAEKTTRSQYQNAHAEDVGLRRAHPALSIHDSEGGLIHLRRRSLMCTRLGHTSTLRLAKHWRQEWRRSTQTLISTPSSSKFP